MPSFHCPSTADSIITQGSVSEETGGVRPDDCQSSQTTESLWQQKLVEDVAMEDGPVYSSRARWESRSYSGISDILQRFNQIGADHSEKDESYDANERLAEDFKKGEDDDDDDDEDGNDNDDDSYDSDDEMEEEEEWKLQLPIYGMIALRRSLKRGEDPFTVAREQHSQLQHEIAIKFGTLRDVKVTFREVDYMVSTQPRTRMARLMESEPVSPGSFPNPQQMSIAKIDGRMGTSLNREQWLEHNYETVIEEYELYSISPSELLECNYFVRRRSFPSAEECFEENNPLKGWPKSAPGQMRM